MSNFLTANLYEDNFFLKIYPNAAMMRKYSLPFAIISIKVKQNVEKHVFICLIG